MNREWLLALGTMALCVVQFGVVLWLSARLGAARTKARWDEADRQRFVSIIVKYRTQRTMARQYLDGLPPDVLNDSGRYEYKRAIRHLQGLCNVEGEVIRPIRELVLEDVGPARGAAGPDYSYRDPL